MRYHPLTRNNEFARAYTRGKSFVHPHVVLYVNKNRLGRTRVGITASKKIGNAVTRNRARRVLRAALYEVLPPDVFSSVFSADQIASISDFNFMFLGIDLSRVPHFAFDAASLMLMIIPILSVVTMILSQIITMKMSGQEMQGAMKWMPWIMSLMFVYFGFTVPVGFSLYYTASNVVMLVQSIILKKMYDPEEMKKQVQAEIEAKRAEKKKKKQVKVTTDDGREQVKEVSEAELARIRLARARELDEERYKDE